MSSDKPEILNGHIREVCSREHCYGCNVCNLFICSVCHGMEGSLLPRCPGRLLSFEEDQANYQHYLKKTGPFMEPKSMTSITLARPANIPYEGLYVDGELVLESGFGSQLDLDEVLIQLACLITNSFTLQIITTNELDFDVECNQLPKREELLTVERVDYRVGEATLAA